MSIERGPVETEVNKVESVETAHEMASLENATREWAKRLAEAIEDPEKAKVSNLPSWARGEVLVRLDLHNLARQGVRPEEIIAYGEECARTIEGMSKYTEKLNGMSKAQLLKEYFIQFIEGLASSLKKQQAYDASRRTPMALAPEIITQPKEYREAARARDEALEKRALVKARLIHGQPK